ncbi:MAG: MOSC domain-containing protein [Candidatus Scalindua sp.]|nr:MOSC domain-containing protein [Candidatus Scalindua sp.]
MMIENYGLEGDAHAGPWHRQISLLSRESRLIMENKGIKLEDGDFGENLMTEGIDLSKLTIGSLLRVNNDVLLRITQIGKECHDRCNIYYQVGDCIMPREGLFAEVLKGGTIRVNDTIEVLNDKSGNSHHK